MQACNGASLIAAPNLLSALLTLPAPSLPSLPPIGRQPSLPPLHLFNLSQVPVDSLDWLGLVLLRHFGPRALRTLDELHQHGVVVRTLDLRWVQTFAKTQPALSMLPAHLLASLMYM